MCWPRLQQYGNGNRQGSSGLYLIWWNSIGYTKNKFSLPVTVDSLGGDVLDTM